MKEKLGVDKIEVFTSPLNDGQYFGLTSKGDIILVNYSPLLHQTEGVIWEASLSTGDSFYLLTVSEDNTFRHIEYIIPTIIEKPIHIHIHHKFYYLKKYPWEYDNDCLIALCNECHFHLHDHEYIPVYENRDGMLVDLQLSPCERCNGAGVFPEYSHVEDGVCFRCNGERYEELILQK
ncbi:MAG: hypothetical protein IPH42_18520 [Bacteroidetes bacterium]|nr:hypothetical protein [Bacteroidota bacterium]